MHFTCRSFIGNFDLNSWSQFWENEPDDPQIVLNHGHLFGLISTRVDQSSDQLVVQGKDFINEINHLFFTPSNAPLLEQLKNSVETVVNNPLFNFNDLVLVLAVVYQDQLFLVSSGLGLVSLLRQNQISTVLTGQKDQLQAISGPIRSEDRILLYTQDFTQKIGFSDIKTTLSLPRIQQIEEEFMSKIYSVDGQSQLSAALIQIHQENLFENQILPETVSLPPDDKFSPPGDNFPPPVGNPPPSVPPQAPPLKTSLLQKLFPQKSVFIGSHDLAQISRRKKVNLIIAILFLGLLAVSSYFGYQKNQSAQTENRYQQLKSDLDKKLSDALAIKNLNLDTAQDLAKQSQAIYTQLQALKVHSDDLSKYEQQIATLLSQTGSSDLFTPSVFFDASIIADKTQYVRLYYLNDTLYLTDFTTGRIDQLSVSQKNTKNLIISAGLNKYRDFLFYNNDIYVYTDTSVSLIKNKAIETKIDLSLLPKPPKVATIQSWNGSLYLLDSQNLSIQKYTPLGSAFSASQPYLKEGQSLSSSPSSMAINGKVWVLSQNGTITPFVRGVKDNFKSNQSATITNAANLLVAADKEDLFFTDNNKLIYHYQKNGNLVSKYNLGNLTISHITLDEKNNLLYVLCTDQKIYQISL